jgi:4-carboxymuconolactone decarboxylase
MGSQRFVMGNQPTFGRYTEIPLERMTPEQRGGYDAIMRDRGICPGPYKIWVENPSIMKLMTPLGVYYRSDSSLNDAEREIATLLMVAKLRAAYPLSEHEWIAESDHGYSKAALAPEVVERMIVGLPVSFGDPRQQVIYEVATALTDSRYVPKGLYDRAVRELGNNGVSDLAVLLGYFCMVSFTLAFHDVPSNASGLQRPSQPPKPVPSSARLPLTDESIIR